MPLRNLPVDPNVLAMWDDGLVEAWQDKQRFTLLIAVHEYPSRYDKMRYWLTFHRNCTYPW